MKFRSLYKSPIHRSPVDCLGLKTLPWIDGGNSWKNSLFFFIEDMNLLSCDLCFDIGNPIMDNLGGHIPNFYGFQAASRVEHCLAPVPKEIFPPS